MIADDTNVLGLVGHDNYPTSMTSCKNGYYFYVSDFICVLCHSACSECTGPSDVNCTACSSEYLMMTDE